MIMLLDFQSQLGQMSQEIFLFRGSCTTKTQNLFSQAMQLLHLGTKVQFKFPTPSATDGAVALLATALLLLIATMEKLHKAKFLKGNVDFSACSTAPASVPGGLNDNIMGFPYWKLTWKNQCTFKSDIGVQWYISALCMTQNLVLQENIIFSFLKAKVIKASDLIVSKYPKKREKMSTENRALYQASNSKVPRFCVS